MTFLKRLCTGVAACGLLLGLQATPALAAGLLMTPVTFVQCSINEPGNHQLLQDASACSLGGGGPLSASGSVGLSPFVLLSGQASAYGASGNLVGGSVTARLEFQFQVTGGNVGDMVTVFIQTNMATVGHDDNKAWSIATLNVGNGLGQGVSAAACSPDLNCDGGFGGGASFHGVLSLQMQSGGPNGSVFMTVSASAGASFVDEFASASADPFFFIDPSLPDAGLYSVTLSPGVVNAPVPEPAPAALLLAGMAAVLAIARRRRPR